MRPFYAAIVLAVLSLMSAPVHAQSSLGARATAHGVDLTWTQAAVLPGTCPNGSTVTAVTTNSIYRGTTSGGEAATPIATPAATTSYLDTTATTPGQTYFYTVSATNCAGEGVHVVEVSSTIANPAAVPGQVTGLTATAQ